MLPSSNQYNKWSLPTKWSFWAAAIGTPISILSLLLTALPFLDSNPRLVERNNLLLQTAQELRYNNEWLTSISNAMQTQSNTFPTGALKTDGILKLVEKDHEWLLRHAYGEEKYIYQHILRLKDLAKQLDSPESKQLLKRNLQYSNYTLHDIHFLNNFLYWYISPELSKSLSLTQLYALGWQEIDKDKFQINGITLPKMKHFVDDGKPILEFTDYLGLID